MIKRGDKVKALVDWCNLIKGNIYTVDEVTNRSISTLETHDLLFHDEYEPVTTEQSEELTNTKRYQTKSGKQLFDILEDDLLSYEEVRGFYKANIYKYTQRYKEKNGIEDLKKVKVYVDQLIKLEEKRND